MSEWWTYRPSDFLMFSPGIYWRLFEALNQSWWPAALLLLAGGLAWLGLSAWPSDGRRSPPVRAGAAVLALCWALSAWAFLLQRFAPINWAATGFAAMFFMQSLLLATLAVTGGARYRMPGPRHWVALALGFWALGGHPLLSGMTGRPWNQAEFFGLAPDPTALGTLAFLLPLIGAAGLARWLLRLLWVVPLLWCAASAAMLLTMGSAQGWVVLAGLAVTLASSCFRQQRASGS